MPNWCCNNLKVEGNIEHVRKFILENFKYQLDPYCKDRRAYYSLDFEVLLPTPIDKETYEIIENWYEWRIENWGCKWSPCFEQSVHLFVSYKNGENKEFNDYENNFIGETILDIKKEFDEIESATLICNFQTPWGPPDKIFDKWKELYQPLGLEVTLDFYEPGCCIMGELMFHGEDEFEEFVDSDNEKEWLKKALEYDWEDIEYYIEEVVYWLEEMHKDEPEVKKKLIPAVESKLREAPIDDAINLIVEIHDKYRNFIEEQCKRKK